jgi:stage II sporulation protein D
VQDPLLSGPTVFVRIQQPLTFTRVQFELGDGALALCDGEGNTLARPEGAAQVYISQQGESLALAFAPGAAAARTAPRYPRLRLRSTDDRLVFFKLTIPELGLHRNYEGREMEISPKYGRLALVNALPLELYLARVLPSEMDPDDFTSEALKAQAVVARTWALRNLGRHQRFGYNFCDSTHCQVYRGRRQVSRRAETAVRQTLGESLTYERRPAEAFYHSTCGGNTVAIEDAWGVPPLPYLRRVEDRWAPGNRPYCQRSPFAEWQVWMSLHRLERAFARERVLAAGERLTNVSVDTVDPSGRVKKMLLVTDRGLKRVPVDTLRRLINQEFGRVKVLSKFFEVQVEGPFFILRGRGLGHGVGLCQWGARGMAQHGFGYREILGHYFAGTALDPAAGVERPWAAGTTPAATVKSQAGSQ